MADHSTVILSRTALVIGAGVVGLAIARELARHGLDVIVAERASAIGQGISSRNSEVIHGGMYYPNGSARQRHCVAGRRLLYDFCERHGVAHARVGKLIVATTPAERARIEAIHAQGIANGVEDLILLDGADARMLEPALACTAAVLSPQTGIVDSHGLMLALQGSIEAHGGAIALNTPIERIDQAPPGSPAPWRVHFGGADPGTMDADVVINAAGLGAQALARAAPAYPARRIPRLILARGNYFAFTSRPVFSHLIYPAPVDGGLGTHVTLDLAGRMRFGPDVEWLPAGAAEDYTVDPARIPAFEASIRRYWPTLPPGRLTPAYAGLRPKLTGPGEPAADFMIDGPAEHGLAGLVMLFGIESPGLTSALSIAREVAGVV